MNVPKRNPSRLQYMGFRQVNSVREYIFHSVEFGQETKVYVVFTELAMFPKHHMGMQEGPMLCLRKLSAELEEAAGATARRRAVTDADMSQYMAAGGFSPGKSAKSKPRRRPDEPGGLIAERKLSGKAGEIGVRSIG